MKNLLAILIAVFAAQVLLVPGIARSAPQSRVVLESQSEQRVAFNTQSRKFHRLSCRWAKKCTKNCVVIPLSEAIRRAGVACKVCGGR